MLLFDLNKLIRFQNACLIIYYSKRSKSPNIYTIEEIHNAISFPAPRADFSCVGAGTAFGRTVYRTQYSRRPRSSQGARNVRAAEH